MKKFCKIISIFITGWFIAMTIPANNIVETAKAEEVEIDEEFINWTLTQLTSIKPIEFWMGREYGTKGEREAAERLEGLWNNNISEGIFDPAIMERITKIFERDTIDEKLGIWDKEDYLLKINGDDIADDGVCYPVTNGRRYNEKNIFGTDITYTVIETPDSPEWYGDEYEEKKDEELFTMELEEELKKENILYEIKCVLLDNCSGLPGEVAYFEDYESASINDTAGRIHLINIYQDECDDVFIEKANNVYNSNGTAFIAMVTNPSFINTLNTSVKGMIISFHDGEQIKQYLENNETVYIEIDEESSISDTEVILKVYHIPQILPRYIYLIDMDKHKNYQFRPRGLGIVKRIWERSIKTLFDPESDFLYASAFLYSDLSDNEINGININENTYLSPAQCVFKKADDDIRTNNTAVIATVPIPGFCITGSKGEEIEEDDEVQFKMIPDEPSNPDDDPKDALSYNVIGKIDNPQSDEVVIICSHNDYFWSQGAIDDASGVAAMYGVAKYIKDHDITLKYDIKFIAFGGEEYYDARGAHQYVWKHILTDKDEWNKIIAVIELDVIGIDTKQLTPGGPSGPQPPIPLLVWAHPREYSNEYMTQYDTIESIINFPNYVGKTGYSYYYPSFDEAYSKVVGGDCWAFRPLFRGTTLVDWIISIARDIPNFYDKDHQCYYYLYNWAVRSFFDHRGGGPNFEYGDVISKIDYNDLYETTKIALDLVAHFAVFDVYLDFDDDCAYTQLDLDDDGQYDSVKVGYAVDSNITAGGQVESIIYQNGQPQTSNIIQYFTIGENETVYGNLTVTLPYNKSAGSCDIRVYLKNYEGDEEDFDNTTIYLYPYNDSIANYIWDVNDSNLKMVNFTDCSTPSPGATINSWNWSFGDGYYSTLQNCSHNYSSMGFFNVTLTVTDTANKSANVTQQIETFNTYPVTLFNVNTTLVLVNKTVAFNSTSYDIDGSIENATWYFGDNTSGYGINTSHSYNKSGYYMVSLFVTDNDNATVKLTKTDHILVVDALVDDGFVDDPSNHSWDTIQEGINDVDDDGIIYVYNGSYQSYLVNKSISILGENKDGVIISSNDIGIDIQCVNVTIKNFTINCGCSKGVNICGTSNCLIENGDIDDVTYGVFISSSNNNTIRGCRISNASTAGIRIYAGSNNNVVDDCEISDCYYGVGVHDSSSNFVGNPSIYDWYPNDCTFKSNTYSVYVDDSDHTSILGCDINSGNEIVSGRKGIYLDEASDTLISTCSITRGDPGVYIKDSRDSKIEFCKITNNINGVEFFGESGDNLITQNQISTNSQYGVNISTDDPDNNTIIYNDFIENGDQLTNQSYDDRTSLPTNNWYKTGNNTLTKNGSGEGNYWDDYTGVDDDTDGIGDSGYELDTGTRAIIVDNYPLMESFGWCRDWE